MNASDQKKQHGVSTALNARLDDLALIVEHQDHRLTDAGRALEMLVASLDTLVMRLDSLEARTDSRVSIHTCDLEAVKVECARLERFRLHVLNLTLWERLRWVMGR